MVKVMRNKRSVKEGKEICKSYDCTYHGWVMVPVDLKDGRKLAFDDEVAMLKISKKVAKSQLTNRLEGQQSKITLSSQHGFMIEGNQQKPKDQPLFQADLSAIVSVLITPEYNCSVIMAFTEDGKGNKGIGCDVIKFHKNSKKVLKKYNSSVNAVVTRYAQQIDPLAQRELPSLPELPKFDKKNKHKKRRSSSHGYMDVCPERRHSVDISAADGGYLTVEMIDSIVNTEDVYDGGYMIVGNQHTLKAQTGNMEYEALKMQNSDENGCYDNIYYETFASN